MNFLTKKTSWSNLELWVYKMASFSGSVLIGAYFYETVIDLAKYIFIIFIITAAWAAFMWVNKLKKQNND